MWGFDHNFTHYNFLFKQEENNTHLNFKQTTLIVTPLAIFMFVVVLCCVVLCCVVLCCVVLCCVVLCLSRGLF